MTCSLPVLGRGPGLLIVGGRPEDALWFAARGLVACVVGEGNWEPALDQVRGNPVVRGRVAVWAGGRIWVVSEEADAEPAVTRLEAADFLLRRVFLARPDLEAIWAKHVECEFNSRDTEATLATMVQDAYVNHIPVLTGGAGIPALREFYSQHFIPKMPADTKLTPISRTVGEDQIVDEMIFEFTHSLEMDWMLPGIAPTGRYVRVPLVAIVKLRGDKLKHEHIYWDQASVLVQLGLLDPAGLPVAGVESAEKAERGG